MFKSYKNRKRNKAQLQRLSAISKIFNVVKKLEEGDLIQWSERHRQLVVRKTLAIVMLSKGKEAWLNFLNNLYIYTMYQLQSRAWDALLTKEQGKAIAKAKAHNPHIPLTSAEIRDIRFRVRQTLAPEAIQPPRIEKFEILIVDSFDAGDSAPLVCGVFDPDTEQLDMALWEDFVNLVVDKTN